MLPEALFKKKLENINNLILSLSKKSLNDEEISIYSHYTSPEAALNIIKNNSFWMTHHRYQNDPSEIEHGKILTLEYLAKKYPNIITTLKDTVDHFINHNYNSLITCFMNHQDYLPGWRYYGKNGEEVAININSKLFPNTDTPRLQSYDVIYNRDNQIKIIDKIAQETLDDDDQEYNERINNFITFLLMVLPIIKNSDYEDEKEWRIFSHHIKLQNGYIFEPLPTEKFVQDATKPTYDRLAFNYSDIVNIHTGPRLDHLYFEEQLKRVLIENNTGIDTIKVFPSKKDYRG